MYLRLVSLCMIVASASAQYGYGGHGLGILPGTGYGYRPVANVHFPAGPQFSIYGSGGSRLGQGYVGNGGIGIKQSDANLADLYGLPRQLAQAPPPRPLPNLAPVNPYYGGYGAGQLAGPYGPGLLGGAYYNRGYLG